jgi:hypothetical protein
VPASVRSGCGSRCRYATGEGQPRSNKPQELHFSSETSLFALSYELGEQIGGVPTQMSRLEQTLNKPVVVLVVGVVAVALNVLLYFGYFLPRMTPLIAHLSPIGVSVPEAIGKLGTEAGSKSDPEAGSKSDPEAGSKSDPEASGKSDPGAGGESGSVESYESMSDLSPALHSAATSSASAPNSSSSSPAASPPPQQSSSPPEASPPSQQSSPLAEASSPPDKVATQRAEDSAPTDVSPPQQSFPPPETSSPAQVQYQ